MPRTPAEAGFALRCRGLRRAPLGHPAGAFTAWALLGLCACAEGGPEFVPPPVLEAGRGLVLAYAQGGSLRYLALDAEALAPLRLELPEGATVEAYVYAQSLGALFIPAGPVTPRATGSPLPAPAARLRLTEGARGYEWIAGTTPSLDGLRLELGTPCRRFEVESVMLGPSRSSLLEPLPDGRLLHGRLGPLWTELLFETIDAAGAVEPAGSIPGPHGFAGEVFGDELWLTGTAGRLTRSPLSDLARTATVAAAPAGDVGRGISIQARGDGFILTTITAGGTLERFDGRAWTTLRQAEFVDDDLAAIAALPDGTELSVVPFRGLVTREREGELTDEPLPLPGGPLAVGVLRGEPVVGLNEGELVVRRNGAWTPLASLPVRIGVRSWLELEGGYLVGGDNGLLVEWNDELGGFCEPVVIEGSGSFEFMRRVGELIVIAGRPPRGATPLSLRLLREVPR